MGDVEDGHALLLEPIDDPKETFRLGFGQGTRRLVHDQDFCVEREGLGDLDELLIADAQFADKLSRLDLAFELLEEGGRSLLHGAIVEETERGTFLTTQENIRGAGELFDEIELLVNDADARGFGVARV